MDNIGITVSPSSTIPARRVRLLISLGAVGVWLVGRHLPAPGIDGGELARITDLVGAGSFDRTLFSVGALGIRSFLSAFVLVEIVAMVVPRWRGLRTSEGPRTALFRASVILGVLFAGFQAAMMVRWLGQSEMMLLSEAPFSGGLFALSLTAWSSLLVLVALLVNRYGLGNGFSLLIAVDLLLPLWNSGAAGVLRWQREQANGPAVIPALACIAGLLLLAHRTLTRHARASDSAPASLRLPTCGLIPVLAALWLAQLPAYLAALGAPLGALGKLPADHPWRVAGLLTMSGLLGLGLASAFHRERHLTGLPAKTALAPLLRRSLLPSVLLVMGAAFTEAYAGGRLGVPVGVVGMIVLLAVGLDVVGEWRASAEELTVIATFHRMHVLRAAETAMAAARIPYHTRGAFHRVLLHTFGPYLPVQILVSPSRASEAIVVVTTAIAIPADGPGPTHSLLIRADVAGGALAPIAEHRGQGLS